MKAPFHALVLFLSIITSARAASIADYQARTYKFSPSKTIPYRLFIPKNYQAGKKYPLILALHGGGEKGTDNISQLNHEFTNFWANDSIQKDNPSFVVVPQCPPSPETWVKSATIGNYDFTKTPITENLAAVSNILDLLAKEFTLDLDRIYISGMSMGGAATWYMINQYPDRFAAAIPVCGWADTAQANIFNKIPIWTFHEVDDPTVPVQNTRDLVKAIQARGGSKLKYTEYPASMGFGHESWKPAAKDPLLHRWLFQQSRLASVTILLNRAKSPVGIAKKPFGIGTFLKPNGTADGLGRIFNPKGG
jgi:predicted peptidase